MLKCILLQPNTMSLAKLLEKNRYKVMRRTALWEGRLSRSLLMDVLGLSGIRVSRLPREVREETPYWFEWDSKSKSYFVTPAAYKQAQVELKASTSDLSLAAYLAEADIHADCTPGAGPVTVAPWILSQVNPNTFSRIRLAVEQGTRLKLKYRSMRPPNRTRGTRSRTAWFRPADAGICVAIAWKLVTFEISYWGVSLSSPCWTRRPSPRSQRTPNGTL